VILSESDTHFPNLSLPPVSTADSSYKYGPKPWIDQFPVFDSAIILVVGIIGLTFLILMIVLLQFMIFGTRKEKSSDDCEAGRVRGGDGSGVGREKEGGRRRKPAYRYGADRVDVYSDPRMWQGTGTDIEAVWFPLEGNEDKKGNRRVVWEDEKPDELSYGKEAIFHEEDPRHAHC